MFKTKLENYYDLQKKIIFEVESKKKKLFSMSITNSYLFVF